MARAGRKLRLPLVDREIPLVADEWAKPELGSGCVKITPAHDPNDYEVGQRQHLPMINILNIDGTLNAQAGSRYAGKKIPEARKLVVADLEARPAWASRAGTGDIWVEFPIEGLDLKSAAREWRTELMQYPQRASR